MRAAPQVNLHYECRPTPPAACLYKHAIIATSAHRISHMLCYAKFFSTALSDCRSLEVG